MLIGCYEVRAIDTGRFRLDGGAMFGVVPKVIWEKTNPADEKNRIEMALRCLLLRGHGKTVLVDSGIGEKWEARQREMYAIDSSSDKLDFALDDASVERSDITDVVLSHLHFDHVGGATRFAPDGGVLLTFPNARYHVHRGNLSHAHAPTAKDRASFIELTIRPLEMSGRLTIHDSEFEVTPGLTTWVTHGHTPGQQLVKLAQGDQTLFFCGDTIPTSSHIPLPYVMAYDLYPMTTIEEKKTILKRAVDEGWILVWAHDPFIAACRARLEGGKFIKADQIDL